MFILESVKRSVEKLVGLGRPGPSHLSTLLRPRKPNLFHLRDDGLIPNNPKLPLILYRGVVRLADKFDPAAIFEELFAANGWRDSWRDGIYDFLHYHSQTHEVLGIARGAVRVQFGGHTGRKLNLKAGDVVVLPAGTGHQRLSTDKDLLVVGAYPASGKYDECRSSKSEHERALHSIPKVAIPKKDPVYGADGPLIDSWKHA